MADKSSGEKAVDCIQEQIRKLWEEMEELERRNREKQQQDLWLMRENNSAPRTGSNLGAGGSTSNRRSLGNGREFEKDFRGHPSDLNASMSESQIRLRSSQQNSHNTSPDKAPSVLDDSREESQRSSDDTEDDVMSQEHKQALMMNRDILVENMTPDDIFNDLISKHILTTADVSRIKDKNTTEAINEELLNVLIRRSDRAFNVFLASLRRTLQGWLANRLEPGSQQKKRKRATGEVNLNIHCEKVVPLSKKKPVCSCQEVEEQILIMAKAAFSHIRRRDGSSSAFEQFKKELKQTNEVLKESMEIVNTLKMLCRHGEITEMTGGSVCITIRCSSLASTQALWEAYESGILSQAFEECLVTPLLLQMCRVKSVQLHLKMSRLEYLTCALELAYKEEQVLQSKQCKPVPTKHPREKCRVNNENMTAGTGRRMGKHNREQVLQEISLNTITPAHFDMGKDFRHGRCTSSVKVLSGAAAPMKSEISGEHVVTRHISKQQDYAAEHLTGKEEVPVYHKKYELNQELFQSCSAAHPSKISGEYKQSHMRIRQESCPYNLRYRLMNQ